MQHKFTRLDGGRVQTDMVLTPIDSAHTSLLKLFEISSPNASTQLRVQLYYVGFSDEDEDIGIVKFKYGERTLIELTFDLEEREDIDIFYTIKHYKVMSTIFIRDEIPNANIHTLIAVPAINVAIAR